MNRMLSTRVWVRRRLRPSAPATHAEVRLGMLEFLDGRVNADVADRITAHLSVCPDCTFDHDTFEAIKAALARQGGASPALIARLEEFADGVIRASGSDGDGNTESSSP